MEFHAKVGRFSLVCPMPQGSVCYWDGGDGARGGWRLRNEGFMLLVYSSLPVQHQEIPPNLEVTDEVLERTAGTDINNV